MVHRLRRTASRRRTPSRTISEISFQNSSTASPTAAYAPIHLVAMATPMVTPHRPSGTRKRPRETCRQSICTARIMKKYISRIQNTA